jgi:hypothetical protein
VFNTTSGSGGTPRINNWELPLFDLGDIDLTSIESPNLWDFEIVAAPYDPEFAWTAYDPDTDPLLDPGQGGDPDLYGPNPEVFDNPPYVLHWYDITFTSAGAGIFPGEFLSGFSFVSNYSARNAPYMASWVNDPPVGGDPPIPGAAFGTPFSPARMAAQGIPEPSSFLLFVVACAPLVVGGHRPARNDNDENLD